MSHPSSHHPQDQSKERSAQKMRRANQSNDPKDQRHAVDAENRLDRPEEAKGRPPASGQSNAGRDGGA